MKRRKHQDIIARSHQRSQNFGIPRDQVSSGKILDPASLKAQQEANQLLLETAQHFILEIHEALSETGFVIVLTDHEGCILKITGEPEIKKAARQQNLKEGAYMDEKHIGTNAMGTALNENAPVQVTAREHFISAYHRWTCSAAPIHDPQGKVIGILNLTGNKDKVHPHTLGLVIEAVKAIESKLQSRQIEQQLYEAQNYAFAMMNNLDYGVLAIDFDNRIQWVNDTACRTINIRRTNLINQPVDELLPVWNLIKEKLLQGHAYQDEPHHFALQTIQEKFLFNAYPIKTKKQETLGFLLSFRSYKKTMRLVNKFGASNAHFTFDDIPGENPQMKQVLKYARSAAGSLSTVLLKGERGVGKEVIAQAIHNASSRQNGGFITVNCGTISHSSVESELFGYEEDAFTGARRGGRAGKFEMADGSTLFLNEIGELPLEAQTRLLRTIQEGAVYRIASNQAINVDVRIIASSHKNLKKEAERGTFLPDLYYRLNVVEITIPALRERKEDILLLALRFLRQKAEQMQKPVPELKDNLKHELMQYHWPGNVRELENFIEATVLFDGDISLSAYHNQQAGRAKDENSNYHGFGQILSIDEAEHTAIKNALRKHKGNILQTAKTLGIGRNTLYNKMKHHHINPKTFHE